MSEKNEKVEESKSFVYFRDLATELGCKNVKELGDLAVWEYIKANRSK